MNTDLMTDVSEYLSELDIEHDILETTLLINRASILARIPSAKKSDSDIKLLKILNARFESQFGFISKSTAGWELDRIGSEN